MVAYNRDDDEDGPGPPPTAPLPPPPPPTAPAPAPLPTPGLPTVPGTGIPKPDNTVPGSGGYNDNGTDIDPQQNVPLPPPPPPPAPTAGGPSAADQAAYDKWQQRLYDAKHPQPAAPSMQKPGTGPAAGAAAPGGPPKPTTPLGPYVDDPDGVMQGNIRAFTQALMNGEISRFTPEVVDALDQGNLQNRYDRSRVNQDAINREAARSGMGRAGATSAASAASERGLESDFGKQRQAIRIQKATADLEDRLKGLTAAQQNLDAMRQYVLNSTKIGVDKQIAEAQIALADRQISAQKQIAEQQLANALQIANSQNATQLQIAAMQPHGGGGGGNSMSDFLGAADLVRVLGG